jgi:hypothetical protein
MNTPKFKEGDSVVFINDYGVNFGKRTITKVEQNPIRGTTYYFNPTDTPWFPTHEKHLFHPDDHKGIQQNTLAYYH